MSFRSPISTRSRSGTCLFLMVIIEVEMLIQSQRIRCERTSWTGENPLCYAGRVVDCSQGSSTDAIRYPARDGAERMTRCTEWHKTAARSIEFMHRFSTHLKQIRALKAERLAEDDWSGQGGGGRGSDEGGIGVEDWRQPVSFCTGLLLHQSGPGQRALTRTGGTGVDLTREKVAHLIGETTKTEVAWRWSCQKVLGRGFG